MHVFGKVKRSIGLKFALKASQRSTKRSRRCRTKRKWYESVKELVKQNGLNVEESERRPIKARLY